MFVRKVWLFTLAFLCFHVVDAQYFEVFTSTDLMGNTGDSRGVIFTDMNGDDLTDLYIVNGPRGGANNEFYLGTGSGFSFQQSSELSTDNTATVGATFADVDNDGDLDGYLANWYGEGNVYYLQEDGAFVRTVRGSPSTGGHSESAAWGDVDGDAFVDLVIANSSFGAGEKNVQFNNKSGDFYQRQNTDFTDLRVNSRSLNWVDIDGDMDLDLFVGNEGGKNEIYLNNEGILETADDNLITDQSATTFGSSWADVDNDGDFDLLVMNFGGTNQLFINDGNGTFSFGQFSGHVAFSIGSAFGDIDNDGDLDVFVANGFADGDTPVANELHLNDGSGAFIQVFDDPAVVTEGSSYGVAFSDFDGDGFVDIAVANTAGVANSIFKNTGLSRNNWLKVKCEGTLSNRSSIGAKIAIRAIINGSEVWQYRHISSQTGYASQSDLAAHFGLGDATRVEELRVTWTSGATLVLNDLSTNELVEVTEPVTLGQFRPFFAVLETSPTSSGLEVQMDNLSVFNESDALTYAWDIGADGSVESDEFAPTLSVESAGTYDIQLTISDGNESRSIVRNVELVNNAILAVGLAGESAIFPNPSRGVIRVKDHFPGGFQLFDQSGKSVLSGARFPGVLDLHHLEEGQYLLILERDGIKETHRLILKD